MTAYRFRYALMLLYNKLHNMSMFVHKENKYLIKTQRNFQKALSNGYNVCYNINSERDFTISGQDGKGGKMEQTITSKEFDLLIALILKMLEKGETEEVIELLKETRTKKNNEE